jgi:hypothetical protein
VHELHAEPGAEGLDPVGHLLEARNAAVVPQGRQPGQLEAGGVGAAAAYQHHARATFGAGHEILGQLLLDVPVVVHPEIDAHGRHEQPVPGGHAADLHRRKKMLQVGHGWVPSPASG